MAQEELSRLEAAKGAAEEAKEPSTDASTPPATSRVGRRPFIGFASTPEYLSLPYFISHADVTAEAGVSEARTTPPEAEPVSRPFVGFAATPEYAGLPSFVSHAEVTECKVRILLKI